MEKFTEVKHQLTWSHPNEGIFNATIVNGKIGELNLCELGAGATCDGKCITTTNEVYLRHVYATLGELFKFIDEENKRLGYSFGDAKALTIPTNEPQNTDVVMA